jgi:hypothetical protein
MAFSLGRIGQIALAVRYVYGAEASYRNIPRLRSLYRFGDLTFFDCSGVRLRILEWVLQPRLYQEPAAIALPMESPLRSQ